MLGAVRSLSVALFVATGTLGISFADSGAMTLPVQHKTVEAGGAMNATGFYQTVAHRMERHRHYRHGYPRRITLGINRARCHSPEWNWIYRHDGLAHQPRHYYTPSGRFYYDDPFWDFQPWWCDDPQIIRRQHDYPSYYRRTSKSAVAHVQWCSDRYQSYDPRFNTWIGNSGRRYQCNSPYDWR